MIGRSLSHFILPGLAASLPLAALLLTLASSLILKGDVYEHATPGLATAPEECVQHLEHDHSKGVDVA